MIFNRQKVLLGLMHACGGSVSRMQLVKVGFLLAHETSTHGGETFYDFLPYKFGPYSFSLVRDMDVLTSLGLVTAPDEQTWALTTAGGAPALAVNGAVGADIDAVGRRWKGKPLSALVDHVYERHPWFTINAQRIASRRSDRPTGAIAVSTLGYEGLSLDAFLDLLLRGGIRGLIDVRANPVSRRFGFHKSTLARHCGHLDIEYVHVPELGIASEERVDLQDQHDRERLFTRYSQTTLARSADAVAQVGERMSGLPSALLCQEADPGRCHRSHLAAAVAKKTKLPLADLGWPR